MKKLFVILFLVIFSSHSNGEWEFVGESVKGDKFYIDIDSIKIDEDYVYYLTMHNRIKKDKWGSLSITSQKRGDCKSFKFEKLEIRYYKQHWAQSPDGKYKPDFGWKTPAEYGMSESYLKLVCNYFNQ